MLLGLLAAAVLCAQTGSAYTAPRLVCSQTGKEVKAACCCMVKNGKFVCQMDEQIVREVLLRTAVKMRPEIGPRMKYWEIIADSLSKAGWSWAVCQLWIPTGERSRLQTHIATAFR